MRSTRKVRALAGFASLALVAAVLAGCSSSKSTTNTGGNSGTPKQGGVVRVAEPPTTSPTAIWPFVTPSQDSTVNYGQFQQLFFRPLYYWGLNDKVSLDPDVSIGNTPVWSADGKSVTVTLKDWKWSNGESITGQDALFWINMSKAEESNLALYTPPNPSINADYFPDNIVSASASGQSFTLNLDKAYNQTWFLDDQLSQITPMPTAWDVTAQGVAGKCSTDTFSQAAASPLITDCSADWKYLSAQSTIVKTFASNPLWQVVDGPWKLKTFTTNGAYSIVPNSSYSGPQKPYLDEVDFVAYTSDTAEYTDLKAGSTGTNAIGVGYVPLQDAAVYNPSNADAGNPLEKDGYTIATPGPLDEISYYQINFTNKDVGPLFSQPYFTTAVQDTVDQAGILKAVQKGWGYNSLGAVPVEPPGNPLSPATKNGSATFNVSAAKALLTQNGWDTSTQPATCTKPGTAAGDCGAGITQGEQAGFTLDYPSGEQDLVTITESMASDAAQAGIKITMTPQTQNEIGSESSPCAATTASGCWQGLLYGGWVFQPDYYPTGDALFATGAGANIWGFSDPQLDQLIYKTTTSSNIQDMYNYEDYIAKKQPVIYMPNNLAITAVANGFHIDAGDPFQGIEPEYWYYTN